MSDAATPAPCGATWAVRDNSGKTLTCLLPAGHVGYHEDRNRVQWAPDREPMAEPTITPALTPDEWAAGRPRLARWFKDEHPLELFAEIGTFGELTIQNSESGTDCSAIVPAEDRYAVAALALYGQPFGFTQDDVAVLCAALEWREAADRADPADRALLESLARRIIALLPPETP